MKSCKAIQQNIHYYINIEGTSEGTLRGAGDWTNGGVDEKKHFEKS